MLKCQKNKFWLENPLNLLCSIDVLPLDDMSLAEQMNCLTRLVIIIFFILFFFGFNQSLLFLLLSLLFIIILYYIQKKHMDRENFKQTNINRPLNTQNLHTYPTPVNLAKSQSTTLQTSKRFCNDSIPLEGSQGGAFNNPNFTSISQKLVGKPNPKTLIPPVVAPPITELEYWRTNNLVTHSAVNEQSNIDVYKSGYQITSCCPQPIQQPIQQLQPIPQPIQQPIPQPIPQPITTESYQQPQDNQHLPNSPYLKVSPNQPGFINTACGYNPEQLTTSGLPSNLPSGNCSQDPVFKEYNQNLFTQTIQPGVFYTNQIIEPINSNIGISFQQQTNPTTVKVNPENGNVFYTEHDPRLFQPSPKQDCETTQSMANTSNVYDPRFTGYGTSYRTYYEPVTGQTRFYYNDVDAIRMPNYIVRSNIDHQPYADQYGPIQAGNEFGNRFNQDIRKMANNSFLEGTLQQRTEIQQRIMSKQNAMLWQRRQAPIHSHSQRSMNGTKK